jgi:hypothetical protein
MGNNEMIDDDWVHHTIYMYFIYFMWLVVTWIGHWVILWSCRICQPLPPSQPDFSTGIVWEMTEPAGVCSTFKGRACQSTKYKPTTPCYWLVQSFHCSFFYVASSKKNWRGSRALHSAHHNPVQNEGWDWLHTRHARVPRKVHFMLMATTGCQVT